MSATTANAIMRGQASGHRRTEKGNLLPKTMGVSRGFGDLKSCSGWGYREGPGVTCWDLDSVLRLSALLVCEVKCGSPEAFLPPNIFLSDLPTSTFLCLNYLRPSLSPHPRSSRGLQILRKNFLLYHSLLASHPSHVLILAPDLT